LAESEDRTQSPGKPDFCLSGVRKKDKMNEQEEGEGGAPRQCALHEGHGLRLNSRGWTPGKAQRVPELRKEESFREQRGRKQSPGARIGGTEVAPKPIKEAHSEQRTHGKIRDSMSRTVLKKQSSGSCGEVTSRGAKNDLLRKVAGESLGGASVKSNDISRTESAQERSITIGKEIGTARQRGEILFRDLDGIAWNEEGEKLGGFWDVFETNLSIFHVEKQNFYRGPTMKTWWVVSKLSKYRRRGKVSVGGRSIKKKNP